MSNIKITISAKLKAGIKFDKEANIFVAYTPALGVFSQGESIDRAKLALEDAVKSFLIVAHKNNLLKKCLKIASFTPSVASSIESLKALQEVTDEYISISEEEILEKTDYMDIFEISAELPLAAVA